jgi:hypothetical protein
MPWQDCDSKWNFEMYRRANALRSDDYFQVLKIINHKGECPGKIALRNGILKCSAGQMTCEARVLFESDETQNTQLRQIVADLICLKSQIRLLRGNRSAKIINNRRYRRPILL